MNLKVAAFNQSSKADLRTAIGLYKDVDLEKLSKLAAKGKLEKWLKKQL